MTDEQIAEKVGITRRTLTNWKRDPAFQERVTDLVAQFARQAAAYAIAELDYRIRRYQARADALDGIVSERAADASMQDVPGSRSGYLVRQLKHVTVRYEADPDDAKSQTYTTREEYYEYAVDTGLLKELRELDKQVSIESGQWNEKREVSGSIDITIAGVDVEQL